MKLFLSAFAALACLTGAALAQTADDQAVRAAVYDYFEGQTQADLARLQRGFDESSAHMKFIDENEDGEPYVRVMEIAPVLEAWGGGEPAEDERVGTILSLNVVDGRMASVLFDSNGRFLDQLTLLKIGDDWKIVSKVFIRQ